MDWREYLKGSTLAVIVIFILVVGTIVGVTVHNNYEMAIRKADDATNYDTKKSVEDTARSMIASYTADKLRYETYKDSSGEEQQSWAEQAKIRANTTAAQYNEFMLKNSFVFKDNIPEDIKAELEYLK
jgi:hypothetical protein